MDNGGETEWTVDNGDVSSSGSSFLVALFNKDKPGDISAQITFNEGGIDEKVINCRKALVKTKTRIK